MNWHISTYGEVKIEPQRHRGVAFKKQDQNGDDSTEREAKTDEEMDRRRTLTTEPKQEGEHCQGREL